MTNPTALMNWPTREEWAQIRRAPYADRFDDLPVATGLSRYASPAQIAAITVKLKLIYAEEGRRMRACGMDDGLTYYEAQAGRRSINAVLKAMREGELMLGATGVRVRGAFALGPEVEALFAPFVAAYQAAHEIAWEARQQAIEATPIDDAAWQRELNRRAERETPSCPPDLTAQVNPHG